MRTVTFSDQATAAYINQNFVPVWVNRNPGFHNCDPNTETHIFNESRKMYATRNIVTFFLTPDLDVIHYLSGYYHPGEFQKEMRFVTITAAKTFDKNFDLRPEGENILREAHLAYAKSYTDSLHASATSNPVAYHVNEGVTHATQVHRDMSQRPLPPLKDLWIKHRFGNGFTEGNPSTMTGCPDTTTTSRPKTTERYRP